MQLPRLEPHPLYSLLRKEKISRPRVAMFLGISYKSLWELLTGRKIPNDSQAEKLRKLTAAIEAGEVFR